jgi:hypothetical protein
MKPAEPNSHQLRACTVSAGDSAVDAETTDQAPAPAGAVSAEIRPDHFTEDALAQTCEGLLVRGGQGHSDKSVEETASLVGFCLCCAIAILLIGFFLNR